MLISVSPLAFVGLFTRLFFQGLKVAVANAQILLDFLCQTGPQLVGEDAAALSSQNTLFAEKVGDLRLRCRLLLTDLGTQVCSPALIRAGPSRSGRSFKCTHQTLLDLPGLCFCPGRWRKPSRCVESAQRERRGCDVSALGRRSGNIG